MFNLSFHCFQTVGLSLAALLASSGMGWGIHMFKAPLVIAGVQPGEEPALRCANSGTSVFVVPNFQPKCQKWFLRILCQIRGRNIETLKSYPVVIDVAYSLISM